MARSTSLSPAPAEVHVVLAHELQGHGTSIVAVRADKDQAEAQARQMSEQAGGWTSYSVETHPVA